MDNATNAADQGLHWLADHGDTLYRFALHRVSDPATAEDLVQETFLAAIRRQRSPADGDDRGSDSGSDGAEVRCVQAWLIGILKHKICDHFRQARRQNATGDPDAGPTWKSIDTDNIAPSTDQPDPSASLDQAEFRDALAACIERLPIAIGQAIRLTLVGGLDAAESSELLGISRDALAARLYRGRLALRQCLTRTWSTETDDENHARPTKPPGTIAVTKNSE
ncbi:RNA polymerase sigma factor [Crateriforma conspicua]|uniref:ECF RNA polymerase sigma factor SigL n=1 Tax=Crateriforma conspicua TaxID=2527996 RepID=A0A5C5Y4B4_9PLAN|nr:RNA polymerase sigma factor [Crateriforma conspicua]TWT69669.1 ECF RNA polymerase sigma factor SigL [Crateriforma conspicua]